MSATALKKPPVDQTKLGEIAAQQPLSGVIVVGGTFAVNGHGRVGYVRKEETEKEKA